MWHYIKLLRYLMSEDHYQKIAQLAGQIEFPRFRKMLDMLETHFSGYQKHHYTNEEFINEIHAFGGVKVACAPLADDLLGIFLPPQDERSQCVIILNEKESNGSLFQVLGHEYGHFLAYRAQILLNGNDNQPNMKSHYARSSELVECINDPEELLADYMVVGAYPREHFVKTFCNRRGQIRWLYQKVPLLLFFMGMSYLYKNYSHFVDGFYKYTRNKKYHFGLAAHLLQVRVFLYKEYGL